MGGLKRKGAPSHVVKDEKKLKINDAKHVTSGKATKRSHLEDAANHDSDDDEFGGFSETEAGKLVNKVQVTDQKSAQPNGKANQFKPEGTTSAEAHAKQRQLAKERKAAKPHADVIQRSKQLWERLRRKSHVLKEERKELVAELFTIINGRVRDFVFKHDSVRVIQCAIKYARKDGLKSIVQELQHDIRDLVESRYGKFLVARMVIQGDQADRDMIIPQFYGHIKRLINHPEASWILDDIYRQVATPPQKAMMLREWYGVEFALFGKQRPNGSNVNGSDVTADLSEILKENPEKRKPILSYLKTMINNLIQKKMTGFTMLHDAMLQYFLALESGSEDHSDFMETLKGDIDAEEEGGGGDLYKNLAFTQTGARLVCLVLAYGSAKDRKVILKCFKENIEIMALDSYAKMVLVTGLDVPDDTKMTSQSIIRELLGLAIEDSAQRFDRLEELIMNLNARVPILYAMAATQKWLVGENEKALIQQVHSIRANTSKKAPEVRRREILGHISAPLLELVSERAESLVKSSFGCQAVTEILLECHDKDRMQAAKEAVANLAAGNPYTEGHIAQETAASRMLKTLVSGGSYDPATQTVKLSQPSLGFWEALYPIIKPYLIEWACSDSSFVIVALLESEDVPATIKTEAKQILQNGKKDLQKAAKGKEKNEGVTVKNSEEKKSKKGQIGKDNGTKGNAGAKILLQAL